MNNRLEIAREFANAINSDKIKRIILFGSVARGDDTEDSDIDILVISNEGKSFKSEINGLAVDFILEKDELISVHMMDEKHFNETKNYSFLQNVLKEGIVIGW